MRILTPQERSSLRWAISLLRVDKWRFVSALLLASLGIGSSIALGATSAWLIARASQMPPVLVFRPGSQPLLAVEPSGPWHSYRRVRQ